jgi:Tol biopolymer transport system component
MMRKKTMLSLLILIAGILSACSSGSVPSKTLSDLPGSGFKGKLLLLELVGNTNKIVELDLASGELNDLFQVPDSGWLTSARLSPDSQQIVLAYTPPPGRTTQDYNTDLFLMPADASSEPQPLLTRQDLHHESLFDPVWASDGKAILFTRLYPNQATPAGPSPYQTDIAQVTLDGEVKVLVQKNASGARISPDGSRIVYLHSDPLSLNTELVLATANGSEATVLFKSDKNAPIDDHIFSLDGSQVIFSMVNANRIVRRSWLEALMGVEIASAHNLPSDWYTVSTTGGKPQRVTHINNFGMAAALSPDGKQIAFTSATGLYLMNLDGSNIFHITDRVFSGSVDWIP